MKYYVCIQNCFEDFYSENSRSLCFDDEKTAMNYVNSLQKKMEHVFDINGEIQLYFSDDEYAEFYQIIDVVQSEQYTENTDCYTHIPDSLYMVNKHYAMNARGEICSYDWMKVEPDIQ